MNTNVLLPMIRHLLSLVAGGLVARGLASESSLDAIAGGLCALLSIGWMWWSRRRGTAEGERAASETKEHGKAADKAKGASLLALIGLMVPLAFSVSCASPDAAAYKTMAGLEATVDHAMNGWADYVGWQRAGAGGPPPELASQEARVKTAYQIYRSVMNAAYDARTTYALDQDTKPQWERAISAAQAAAGDLVNLVNLVLKQ